MNKYIIKTSSVEKSQKELDEFLIPNEIYNETISKEKLKIQKYFINNPKLLYKFVGFNSKLKFADLLKNNRKCGCFYTVPWKTKYADLNNLDKTILLFNQQTLVYRYMIRYWYLEDGNSYLRYLSNIALEIISDLRRINHNLSNNLEYSFVFHRPWSIWKSNLEIKNYISKLKLLK